MRITPIGSSAWCARHVRIDRKKGSFRVFLKAALRNYVNDWLRARMRDPVATLVNIADVELASRLSYFLWSSMPDEELLHLGESGKLHNPSNLDAQLKRMLADPNSSALAENFASQWLEIRSLDAAKPDKAKFPDWGPELKEAMKTETRLFFETVMRENQPVADFIDGKEAERIGLVSLCVPADKLMDKAMEVARKLARGPQQAVRFTKRSLNNWLRVAGPAFDASLALEMMGFFSADLTEGVSALQEKRQPSFPGFPKPMP